MPTSLPTSKGEHLAFDITIVIFVNQMFFTLYLSGPSKGADMSTKVFCNVHSNLDGSLNL
jgi:hypothetical protein